MNKLFILFSIILVIPFCVVGQDEFKTYKEVIKGSDVSFNMIAVKGGEFLLGSRESELHRDFDEGPQKKIVLSDFWVGETEITYDVYQLFFEEAKDPEPKPDGISRPSPPYIDFTLGMGKTGGYPANSMQQYAALMFCKWLYKKTGIFYRLPTEAEWEYVAKLSYNEKEFSQIDTLALLNSEWFANNAGGKYHKVGLKKPSALGLYDVLGNVAEWTLDEYDEKFIAKLTQGSIDPVSLKTKRYPSTVRGGNFGSFGKELRPSNRIKSNSIWNRRDPQIPKSIWWNADSPFVGFRVVRPFLQPSANDVEKFFEIVLK
jgi:formylglycine-generating enzyme required for sulfatase activity